MAGKRKEKHYEPKALKGAVFALLITVFCVLILALVVKNAEISDETITMLNQAIKIISIFAGALVATRGLKKGHLGAGALAGGIYIVLGYLTFSLIQGRFGDILLFFADLAMGVVIGMLTGIIFGRLLSPGEKTAVRPRTSSGRRARIG